MMRSAKEDRGGELAGRHAKEETRPYKERQAARQAAPLHSDVV